MTSQTSERVLEATLKIGEGLLDRGVIQVDQLPDMLERIGAALSRVESAAAPGAHAAGLPIQAAGLAERTAGGAAAHAPDRALAEAGQAARQAPAVPISQSVHPDYLICLEDGRKLKMLKRHLKTAYGMTPEQYRHKWGLPDDYPMVAENYRALRRRMAQRDRIGGGFTGTTRALPDAGARDAAQHDHA
jgi:predicted transcriptional regulator